MNSVHAIYCGMHAFLFLRGEETQNRKAARGDASPSGGKRRRKTARRQEETQARKATRGDASPQGGREKRDPVRRPCGFAIRRQKRFDRFFADLKSAAVGFSYLL